MVLRRAGRATPAWWPPGWSIASATTHSARGRGLLGRDGLGDLEGLWLPVRSVHTIGMRFALDLVWLDAGGAAIRLDEGVRRVSLRTCLAAHGGVVEVAAGRGAALAAAMSSCIGVDPGERGARPARRAC
nr:DUF192 domain-containing protein [Patulibacter minatonensis]